MQLAVQDCHLHLIELAVVDWHLLALHGLNLVQMILEDCRLVAHGPANLGEWCFSHDGLYDV